MGEQPQAAGALASADARLASLETKVSALLWLVGTFLVLLFGAAGTVYWYLNSISRDIGTLAAKVDGSDKEAFMKLASAVEAKPENTGGWPIRGCPIRGFG